MENTKKYFKILVKRIKIEILYWEVVKSDELTFLKVKIFFVFLKSLVSITVMYSYRYKQY